MARQLWVLRHADAEPHGSRADSERRLTERGEQQARAAGAAIARMGESFEAILFSPKVRARQTAELAFEQWESPGGCEPLEHSPLAGGFGATEALDALAGVGTDGRLLIVGHEPDLSMTIAALTGAAVDLKKGGLALVRLDGPRGELLVLMRPRELALIAGVPVGGQ
jgi:phosphohistidine phosphatase